MTCRNQFLAMIFGQLDNCERVRKLNPGFTPPVLSWQ
ncbi:MAG: hypothetical protein IKY60_06495 [Bacteroidales bacterium]|nr:hypothetical protein [Bacteroidales bacterium]